MESRRPFPGFPVTRHAPRLGRLLLVLGLASVPGMARANPTVPPVPLEQLAPAVRGLVAEVLQRPTLTARSSPEVFSCQPATYHWLLDHPQAAARLWRQLGAKVADIQDLGNGHFLWRDDLGSQVRWRAVLRGPRQRVWYASGRVRPGRLLPTVGVKAVAVLDHAEGMGGSGRPAVRQQFHLVLHTDSRAVALATRLLGSSAPRLASDYTRQLGLFFGALAWYLDQHPGQAAALFRAARLEMPPELVRRRVGSREWKEALERAPRPPGATHDPRPLDTARPGRHRQGSRGGPRGTPVDSPRAMPKAAPPRRPSWEGADGSDTP